MEHLEEMLQRKITGAEMTLVVTLEQGFLGERPGIGGVLKSRTPLCRWRDHAGLRWSASDCPLFVRVAEWDIVAFGTMEWTVFSNPCQARTVPRGSNWKSKVQLRRIPVNAWCFLSKRLSHSSSKNEGALEERLFRPFSLLTAPAATRQDKWFSPQQIWWKRTMVLKGSTRAPLTGIKHVIVKGYLQIASVIFLILLYLIDIYTIALPAMGLQSYC